MARKKADKKDCQIDVKSFEDIRNVLVDTLNRISNKSITASEAKTIAYILQTLLSVQKQIVENEDSGGDSLRELVSLIQSQREKQGAE